MNKGISGLSGLSVGLRGGTREALHVGVWVTPKRPLEHSQREQGEITGALQVPALKTPRAHPSRIRRIGKALGAWMWLVSGTGA